VRDTIARQSDVDKDSIKYEVEPGTGHYRNGTVTFAAKKGKSIDLKKLHDSIKATRLSGQTRSAVNYLEITAEGEVIVAGKATLLKVSGTAQQFALGEDPKARSTNDAESPFQRLREALARGEKVTSVTGRVHGWTGPWPVVLRALPGESVKGSAEPDKLAGDKRPLLLVTDFRAAKD
jgi:hypothetical protein